MRNIFILLALLFSGNAAEAAELFATVESLAGSASVSDPSGQPTGIFVGQKIYEKQTVATAADGEVHLATVDGGIVALRQNTVFKVDEYRAEGSSADRVFMSLFRGAIRSITGWIGKYNAPGYRITTPTATIGIRGTDHETTVIEEADGDEPGTYDMVNEGVTVLKTQYGESEVTPEKFAFAPRYRAVAPFLLVKKPVFWEKRKLRIEERIQQRKEALRGHIEQIREERIQHLKKIHSERSARAEGKAAAKEERIKMRADRLKRTEQRREAKRKEARLPREQTPNDPHMHREKRREAIQGNSPGKADRRPLRPEKHPPRRKTNEQAE